MRISTLESKICTVSRLGKMGVGQIKLWNEKTTVLITDSLINTRHSNFAKHIRTHFTFTFSSCKTICFSTISNAH